MYPDWKNKTNPQLHRVRFLAALWQQKLKNNPRVSRQIFIGQNAGRTFGQLKKFERDLGDLAQVVIEWVLQGENWWRFTQQVRAEAKLKLWEVPDDPEIWFLAKHRQRVLRIMRHEVRNSTEPAHVDFCATLDQSRFQQFKSLALVFAADDPKWLPKIAAAETLTDIQRVFIELVDAAQTSLH